MDEYTIEEMIMGMARIVQEKHRLEEENFYLKQRLDEQYEHQKESLRRSQNQVADILSTLVSRSMRIDDNE